jgi:hypothetical protein
MSRAEERIICDVTKATRLSMRASTASLSAIPSDGELATIQMHKSNRRRNAPDY